MSNRGAFSRALWLTVLLGGISTLHAGVPAPSTAGPQAPAHLAQERTLKAASNLVCPWVLPLLLENGYVVRSVNEHLGLISFSRQRADPFRSRGLMNITMEGSLLFQPDEPGSTHAYLLLSRRLEKSTANGTNLEVELQLTATPDEYTKVWSILDAGLAALSSKN